MKYRVPTYFWRVKGFVCPSVSSDPGLFAKKLQIGDNWLNLTEIPVLEVYHNETELIKGFSAKGWLLESMSLKGDKEILSYPVFGCEDRWVTNKFLVLEERQ